MNDCIDFVELRLHHTENEASLSALRMEEGTFSELTCSQAIDLTRDVLFHGGDSLHLFNAKHLHLWVETVASDAGVEHVYDSLGGYIAKSVIKKIGVFVTKSYVPFASLAAAKSLGVEAVSFVEFIYFKNCFVK